MPYIVVEHMLTFDSWKLFQKLSKLDMLFWKYYPIGKVLTDIGKIYILISLQYIKIYKVVVIASNTYWKNIYLTMENIIKLEKFLLHMEACVHNQMYV